MSALEISNLVRTPAGFCIRTDKVLTEKEFNSSSEVSYSNNNANIRPFDGKKFIDVDLDDNVYSGYTLVTANNFSKPAVELESIFSTLPPVLEFSGTRYELRLVHKYLTIKKKPKEYQYDILDKESGQLIVLLKEDIEDFFKNPDWDGSTLEDRLIAGKDKLVIGLSQYYQKTIDHWQAKVDESVPVVIDKQSKDDVSSSDNAQGILDYYKANKYTLTEVFARTIMQHGKKEVKVYKYLLSDNKSGEVDYFTSQEILNLIDTARKGEDRYDDSRIDFLQVKYSDSRYSLIPDKDNVKWHIDEVDTDTDGKYVCLKAYVVRVNSTDTSTLKPVEFEVVKVSQDDLEQYKRGVLIESDIRGLETFVLGLDAMLVEVEKPLADSNPFYSETKIDNLKVINSTQTDIYSKYANIEFYSDEEIKNTITKIKPEIEELDYSSWVENNQDIANRIKENVLIEEKKAIPSEISWEDIKSYNLDTDAISFKGITIEDFARVILSSPVRVSTLLEDDTYPLYYDIYYTKDDYFLLKEKAVEDSLRTGLVRKLKIVGENDATGKELGIDYLKFVAFIIDKLQREAVLIIGKDNDNKYLIAYRKEIKAENLLNDSLIYVPVTWNYKFSAIAIADSMSAAEEILSEYLDNVKNHPDNITYIEKSIKKDDSLYQEAEGANFESKPTLPTEAQSPVTIACKVTKTNNNVKVEKSLKSRSNTYSANATITYKGYLTLKSNEKDRVNSIINSLNNTSKLTGAYVAHSLELSDILLIDGDEGVDSNTANNLSTVDRTGAIDFWNSLGGDIIEFDDAIDEYFDKIKATTNLEEVSASEEITEEIADTTTSKGAEEFTETSEPIVEDEGVVGTIESNEPTTESASKVDTFKNNVLRGSLDVNVDRVLGSTQYTTRTLFDAFIEDGELTYQKFRELLKNYKKGIVNSIFENCPNSLKVDGSNLVYNSEVARDGFTIILKATLHKDEPLKNIKFELRDIAGHTFGSVAKALRVDTQTLLDSINIKENNSSKYTFVDLLASNSEIEQLYNNSISNCKYTGTFDEMQRYFTDISMDKLKEISKLVDNKYLENFGLSINSDGAIVYKADSNEFSYILSPPSMLLNKDKLAAEDMPLVHAYIDYMFTFIDASLKQIENDSNATVNGASFNYNGKAKLEIKEGSLIESDDTNYKPISVKNYADTVFKLLPNGNIHSYEDLGIRAEIWSASASYKIFSTLSDENIKDDYVLSINEDSKEIRHQIVINSSNVQYILTVRNDNLNMQIELDNFKTLTSQKFIKSWIEFDEYISKQFNDILKQKDTIDWSNLEEIEKGDTEAEMEAYPNDIDDLMSMLDDLEDSGKDVSIDADIESLPSSDDIMLETVEVSGQIALEVLDAIINNLDSGYNPDDEDALIGANEDFELYYKSANRSYTTTEEVTDNLLKLLYQQNYMLSAELKDYLTSLRTYGTVLGIIQESKLIYSLYKMIQKYGTKEFVNHSYEEKLVKANVDDYLKDIYKEKTGIDLRKANI